VPTRAGLKLEQGRKLSSWRVDVAIEKSTSHPKWKQSCRKQTNKNETNNNERRDNNTYNTQRQMKEEKREKREGFTTKWGGVHDRAEEERWRKQQSHRHVRKSSE